MGMFDNLTIKTEMLPITDKEKEVLGKDPGWQTKDFDCVLSTAEITEDGKLRFDYGVDKKVSWVYLKDYTGSVNFYTDDKNGDWWEFDAEFTGGKLVKIVGGKEKI